MGSSLNQFNLVAPVYDRLATIVFGKSLLTAQMFFLNQITPGDHILIIGGGSGDFLLQILQRYADVQVTYVEASDKMIAYAKRKSAAFSNVDFIHGDETSVPEGAYDIIITNFVLDVFTQDRLSDMIIKLEKYLSRSGTWLVTDFAYSSKLQHRMLLRAMYYFFRVTAKLRTERLPNWHTVFESVGLKLTKQAFFRGGFVVAQRYQKSTQFEISESLLKR
jgi:tRNA (cmo5U34)-methyltransferase